MDEARLVRPLILEPPALLQNGDDILEVVGIRLVTTASWVSFVSWYVLYNTFCRFMLAMLAKAYSTFCSKNMQTSS